MGNELTETETPNLSPPNDNNNSMLNNKIINNKNIINEELQTPDSISSSIENYSPVIPSIAHIEKYTNNISNSDTEVIETVKKKIKNNNVDDV
ncbi:hypothetical protein C6P40_003335, partial [Pichia californica]